MKIERIYSEFDKTTKYYIDGKGWITKKEMMKIEGKKTILLVSIRYFDVDETGEIINEGYEDFSKDRWENLRVEHGFNTKKQPRGKGSYSYDLRKYVAGKKTQMKADKITCGRFAKRLMGKKKFVEKFVLKMEEHFVNMGYELKMWKI